MPGTTLKASPAWSTVGTAVSRCGPVRILAARDRLGRRGQRQQRVDALVGRRARVRAAPVRGHAQRAGRLAADDHGLEVVVGQLAGLEAQAGVEAREARDVDEGPDAPLLVAHEQQRGLREGAPRAWRARAGRRARARRRPSCRSRPSPAAARRRASAGGARRGRRRCRGGRAAAAAASPSRSGGGAGRRRDRARSTSTRSIVASSGASAATSAAASSAPWTSPLGVEIATSASSSRSARAAMAAACSAIHGSTAAVPFHDMASAPHVGDLAPDFTLEGTDGSFRLSEHRGQRVVLLFYPGDETVVCTKQFCSYRDRADDMSALDAAVVGISHQEPRVARGVHRAPRPDRAAAGRRRPRGGKAYGVSAPVHRHAPRRVRDRRGRHRPPSPRAHAGPRLPGRDDLAAALDALPARA